VPGKGLAIVAVLMTTLLVATMSPTIADQFNRIVDLAVILAVIPYVYASVAVVKVVHDHGEPKRTFVVYKWIALTAVAYCLWTVVGGEPRTVVRAMVALLLSVPLYPFFIRSMEAAGRRRAPPMRPMAQGPIPRNSAPADRPTVRARATRDQRIHGSAD
jgi:arginine:agmatine antiporter